MDVLLCNLYKAFFSLIIVLLIIDPILNLKPEPGDSSNISKNLTYPLKQILNSFEIDSNQSNFKYDFEIVIFENSDLLNLVIGNEMTHKICNTITIPVENLTYKIEEILKIKNNNISINEQNEQNEQNENIQNALGFSLHSFIILNNKSIYQICKSKAENNSLLNLDPFDDANETLNKVKEIIDLLEENTQLVINGTKIFKRAPEIKPIKYLLMNSSYCWIFSISYQNLNISKETCENVFELPFNFIDYLESNFPNLLDSQYKKYLDNDRIQGKQFIIILLEFNENYRNIAQNNLVLNQHFQFTTNLTICILQIQRSEYLKEKYERRLSVKHEDTEEEKEREDAEEMKTIILISSLGCIPLFLLIGLGVFLFIRHRRRNAFANSIGPLPPTNIYSKMLDNAMNVFSKIESNSSKVEKVEECIICLQKMTDSEDILESPCHHIFHSTCIKSWVYSRLYSPHCPLCNFDLRIESSMKSNNCQPLKTPNSLEASQMSTTMLLNASSENKKQEEKKEET